VENSIIDFILGFILAYLFYVIIECPFSNLIILWFKPKSVQEETHKNGVINNNNENNNSYERNKDYGHSNDIELEEGICMDRKVRLEIPNEETINIRI